MGLRTEEDEVWEMEIHIQGEGLRVVDVWSSIGLLAGFVLAKSVYTRWRTRMIRYLRSKSHIYSAPF